jgi:hypothetical protein
MQLSLHGVTSIEVHDIQRVHQPGTMPTTWRSITIHHQQGETEVTMFVKDDPLADEQLAVVGVEPDRRDA